MVIVNHQVDRGKKMIRGSMSGEALHASVMGYLVRYFRDAVTYLLLTNGGWNALDVLSAESLV